MDCSRLGGAYQELLRAARALTDVSGGAESRDMHNGAYWTLCHVALYDRNILTAALKIAGGERPVVVESGPEMCPDAIGALIAQHTPRELIDLVEGTAMRLLAAVESIPETRADTAVRVRLVTRQGVHAFDDWLGWRDLLSVRADDQLPRHARFIAGLADLASGEDSESLTSWSAAGEAPPGFLEASAYGSEDDHA